MKSQNGEEYCDKCHLAIAPKDPGRLDYGKVQYHAPCYIAWRRDHETKRIRSLVLMLKPA